MTFDDWVPASGAEQAFELFKDLASIPSWSMLLCYGKAGCGKTHLCEALVRELKWQGRYTRVYTWSDIVLYMKETMHSEFSGSYEARLHNFKTAERLIIDDVGSGTMTTPWEWGLFEDIISHRYREGLLTVITTNLDLKDLPERVVSRFRDKEVARICWNKAGDYRPRKV